MPDFLLADDLSGALDAGAAFHRAGRRVTTLLDADATAPGSDFVALTTETRNAAPALAAEKVASALAAIRAAGGRLVFKKIDSTMRGPVAAELAALAAAMPAARILFTPANPAVGRTVRGGVLFVHGVPVAETDFARDPASPVRASALRELLGTAATERVEIADAATAEDLAAAVARLNATGQPWIGVGSSALAGAVAAAGGGRDPTAAHAWPRIDSPAILMVCGSAHPLNRGQADRLRQERGVAVHEVRVAGWREAVAAATAEVRAGRGAALAIEPARAESAAALRAIVAAAAETIAAAGVRRLFVTGGETAFAICGSLGVGRLEFLEEIETGVGVSAAVGADGARLLAVKPGGFGAADTWVRIWDRLGAA